MKKRLLLAWALLCLGRLSAQTVTTLDNCESTTGWRGGQAVTIDSTDPKQGSYSIRAEGAGTDRFNKAFTTPVNTGITNLTEGFLVFWLYIDDVTKLSTSSGQVEITSAGRPDVNEYNWPVRSINLQNGWNEVVLKLTAAGTTGGVPDLSAINFFRLYQPVTGSAVFKIDHIRFSNGILSTPIANAHTLNACDDPTAWSGSDTIRADAANKVLGNASLRRTGRGDDWFVYHSPAPFNTTVTAQKGILKCRLFVSNSALLKDSGAVVLSSSGNAAQDAFRWSLSSQHLQTGWNHIFLRLSEAQTTGSPDLSNITYFKLSHPVSGSLTARLDEIELFEPQAADPNTLDAKVMFGYQGWFSTPNDGQGVNWWKHWFGQSPPIHANSTFDIWPDLRDYPDAELDATQMLLSNGSPAKLFSHYRYNTVDLHFRWLQENELDGVFLQRFLSTIRNNTLVQTFKKVIENTKAASEKYQRVYCIMYDLSGGDFNTIADVKRDWMQLVDNMQITAGPTYLKHKGKPLVALWGLGISTNPGATPQQADSLVRWFWEEAPEQYRATVMGGINDSWLSQGTAWVDVFKKLDVISPWSVGRYSNESGANNFLNTKVKPEVQYCNNLSIDYMPVIWPGFSWYNLQTYRGQTSAAIKNQIPRNGGSFYWQQSYNVMSAGAKMVYIAMLDEVDEGTSMFKMAKSAAQAPANDWFLTLDADGYDLTPDWFLSLSSYTKKVYDRKTTNSIFIPLRPNKLEATLLTQAITFPTLTGRKVGDPDVDPGATASSGLPVYYTSSDTNVAIIVNGQVHIKAAGTTTITASQDGNGQYYAAPDVSQALEVTKREQTITFATLPPIGVISEDLDPGATASSGLPVQYTIINTGIATMVNGKIHPVSVGETLITAEQPGNDTFLIAVPVSRTLTVYDNQPPTKPLAVTAARTNNGNIQLLWQASTDNVGVTGYYIYEDGVLLNTQPVAGTSFVIGRPGLNNTNTYTIKATDAAGNLSEASAAESVGISIGNGVLGMETMKLFPNPTPGFSIMLLRSSQTGNVTITVTNAAGAIVQRITGYKIGEYFQKDIWLINKPQGLYQVNVSVGSFNLTKILIVQ